MKAGLQQIPIQGAAPRLAGNREWDGLPMPTRFWAILAVAFGVSLSVIDGAIANVALPTMARMLGISSANSIWIVNAYQLAIMVSLLSLSALGDVVGYRKVYIGGLMLFTVASVGCSLSGSLQALVLARVMQGFGAAAITSVNTSLIRFIYPKARLGRGMGVNATVVATSSVAGPTLAAGILSAADWPWLFAVNVPIGLAALALSRRFLPENPVRVREHRFDWRDAVMNALTFGLMMASVEGFSHGLDPRVLSLGVAALIVVGFFFIRGQLREPYPILPFDLLRIPIFSVSVATSVCSFLGQMLAMVALPFYLQQACGYNDVETTAADGLARRDHGRGPGGRAARRAHSRRAAGRHGAYDDGRGTVPAGLPAGASDRFRHHLAAGALRRGIRTVPIAQQQHPDRLGPARTERFGERHAGHRTPRGTNDGRRADGPAVPRRARKQHPHGPAAGGQGPPSASRASACPCPKG